jgi:hypothetical protein
LGYINDHYQLFLNSCETGRKHNQPSYFKPFWRLGAGQDNADCAPLIYIITLPFITISSIISCNIRSLLKAVVEKAGGVLAEESLDALGAVEIVFKINTGGGDARTVSVCLPDHIAVEA